MLQNERRGTLVLVVALTGGIGSGKSTVSRHFETLGVPVIDADLIARDVVTPGSPALQEIRQRFGPAIIQADGRLDRAQLRGLVFEDNEKRQQLEAILHPRILSEMKTRLKTLTAPYAVLVIPLLLESNQRALADRILVVDCPTSQQIERVQVRDGLEESQTRQIIAAQADRATRLAAADDVLDNSGSLEELLRATEELHRFYLELAS
jgi:dephospho-CoA kinase